MHPIKHMLTQCKMPYATKTNTTILHTVRLAWASLNWPLCRLQISKEPITPIMYPILLYSFIFIFSNYSFVAYQSSLVSCPCIATVSIYYIRFSFIIMVFKATPKHPGAQKLCASTVTLQEGASRRGSSKDRGAALEGDQRGGRRSWSWK
jgi:hypothetical protein